MGFGRCRRPSWPLGWIPTRGAAKAHTSNCREPCGACEEEIYTASPWTRKWPFALWAGIAGRDTVGLQHWAMLLSSEEQRRASKPGVHHDRITMDSLTVPTRPTNFSTAGPWREARSPQEVPAARIPDRAGHLSYMCWG